MSKQRIIDILPYEESWTHSFIEEERSLYELLSAEIVRIDHIGSTAVAGLCAKPIIDVLVEVVNVSRIDDYADTLIAAGYKYKGENGIAARRYLVKGTETLHTHHIHIFEKGNPEIARHLNFRDYLRAFPAAAAEYGKLKIRLAGQFKSDPVGYTDGKSAFIQEIDKLAAGLQRHS